MKQILIKLSQIQNELKVPKNQRNDFGKYNYRNCEDILEALKPHLAKTKTVLRMEDNVKEIAGRFYVEAIATLYDTESDEFIVAKASAREEEVKKGMDGSQITGASSSYARKYALNGLFAIDDTKTSDTTNKGETTKKGKDDAPKKVITQEQKDKLMDLGVNLDEFAAYCKVKTTDEIPFDMAQASILKREKQGGAK
jgi:hypothetical protein